MSSYRGDPNICDEIFRKYFYSSELPQKEDAFELHSRLQHLIECHRHMKKNINVLNITLEALRRNCDDLSGVVDSYSHCFRPLSAYQTMYWVKYSFKPHRRKTLFQRWRIVAQSTPRLWSKLHIVLPHKREENIDGDEEYLRRRSYVSLVKRLLRLSGNAPLSISISVSQGYGPCTDMSPTAKELLITVIKHSARWSEVDLFCSSDAFNFLNSEMVKDTPQPSLPLLRRVRVGHIIDPYRLPSGSSGALYPYTSSALRELSLSLCDTITPFLLRLQQPVSWRLLTHLSIHGYASGPQWLLSILPQCEQLEALLLGMREACHDDSVGPRHLPKLQSLSLQGTQDYIDDFVGCLETPLLTQFTFYTDQWNDTPWHVPNAPQLAPRFRWFLTQCGQMQSLTLSPHNLSVEMFVAIVEAVPGITTLTINTQPFPSS
ncbi:hypothetical protein BJ165DRAFT_1564437 [Panaeolus papilionaceus]|nr:hypothetical protein BJ165DRAFT_1564437 [Panaeolus papilionaceus]